MSDNSLFKPGENVCSTAHAGRVAFIVDAEAYFDAFRRAAERAQRAITILGWDFNSRTRLHYGKDDGPGSPPPELGDFLNFLARRRRGLRISILDWDYPIVFGTDRELPPLLPGFGWEPHRRVHLRYDNTHPVAGCQHQKIVLVDDAIAFCGGLDLTVRRWDTTGHQPGDPRRMAYDKPYAPFHDVMMAVDGDAARELAAIARKRWQLATGRKLPAVSVRGDPWPDQLEVDLEDVEVGIACTAPARNGTPVVREVEQLYLDMIGAAKRLIYIENQYFTVPKIADALAARLAEPDGPEIVLVLRLLSHGWLEEHTMQVLRSKRVLQLQAADRHWRFHVYYPDVEGLAKEQCIDVHSKVMLVDEEILRIGSANVSSRSMGMDTECDLAIEARGDQRIAGAIAAFRDRLLGEHLGAEPAKVREALERTGKLHAAITEVGNPKRTLQPLQEKEWPEALLSVASIADPTEPIALDSLLSERTGPEAPHAKGARGDAIPWMKIAVVAVVVAGLTALWRLTPLADVITADRVMQLAQDFGSRWWAPLVILVAYTPASIVLFPRPLITLAAVVAFGPWLGFVYALAGIEIAALACYVAGRGLRRDTVRRIAGRRLDHLTEVLRARGFVAIMLLRLVPIAPFAIESLVAGAIRIKLWHYVAGTAAGMLPGLLTATVFGSQIEAALTGSGRINYWLVGAVLAVFAVGTWLVKRWFGREQAKAA